MKAPLLLTTHLLALGIAYGVARNVSPPHEHEAAETGAPVRSKSRSRDRDAGPGDGGQLLAEFLKERADEKSKYDELKASLPVAKDRKGAAMEAIKAFEKEGFQGKQAAELFVLMQVRVLHWMRENPAEAVDFLNSDPFCVENEFGLRLEDKVYADIVRETGVLRSLAWLTKDHQTLGLLVTATAREMKEGGGLALFEKLRAAMAGNPLEETLFGKRGGNAGDAESAAADPFADETFNVGLFNKVGGATAFGQKEQLLDIAMRETGDANRSALLMGFAKSDERATAWLLELVNRGTFEGKLASSLRGQLGNAVLRSTSMALEDRVEARRATKGNETKARQSIVNELVGGDVSNLLENGRDWRYEFRHGTATADEVMAAMHDGVPIPADGEDAVRVTLYRHLSEEDPEKALPLLDGLPAERRREVLYDFTMHNQGYVSPDTYLRFMATVPEPETPKEQETISNAWTWKAREGLERYSEDYVDWVRQMPPGPQKDAAMYGVVRVTQEANPARARELNDQFFPKKP